MYNFSGFSMVFIGTSLANSWTYVLLELVTFSHAQDIQNDKGP